MKRILILYTSKYGSTERYARLLNDELKDDAEVTVSTLKAFKGKATDYDTIIYGAGIKSYAMYNIDKFMKKIKKVDATKTRLIVFAVGMMSADKAYARRLIDINEIDDRFKFYYLRGAIDINKLKGFDASIIKHLVSALMLRDDLTPDEKEFVSACLNTRDWTCRDNILSIAEMAR